MDIKKIVALTLILTVGLAKAHGDSPCSSCVLGTQAVAAPAVFFSSWSGFALYTLIVAPITHRYTQEVSNWIKSKIISKKKQTRTCCDHECQDQEQEYASDFGV